jgi:hypothetical protein
MVSLTHCCISSAVMLAGLKFRPGEDTGGTGVVSPLVSGDEVGGRWEESGCRPVGRENGEVMVEVVLSEDECAS